MLILGCYVTRVTYVTVGRFKIGARQKIVMCLLLTAGPVIASQYHSCGNSLFLFYESFVPDSDLPSCVPKHCYSRLIFHYDRDLIIQKRSKVSLSIENKILQLFFIVKL